MFLMLLRLALTIFAAFILGKLVSKLRLPAILGWLLAGMLLGPHAFALLDEAMMQENWYTVAVHCLECAVGPVSYTHLFVGPCIAKMAEAEDVRHEDVDAVLTFEDMEKWFKEERLDLNALDAAPFDGPDAGLARMYPTCAGVIQNAVARGLTGYDTLHVEGAEECKELFRAIQAGEIHGCLIEMNICQGSCMGGPKAGQEKRNRFTGALAVEQYAKKSAQPLGTIPEEEAISLGKVFVNRRKELAQPDEETIRSILRSIGKESKMDELNCGSCGYPSCRAKAIAVFQGKAELSMCLPHMCQAAQSMSNVVLDSTPNAIVIVDEEMKIKEVNSAAQKMFRVSRQEALERSLYEFMDATDFEYVLQNFDAVTDKKRELDEFGVVVRETLVYLPKQHGVMGILNAVSYTHLKPL